MLETSEQSEGTHKEKPGEKPSEKPDDEEDDDEDLFGGDDDDDEPAPEPAAAVAASPPPAPAAPETTNQKEGPVVPKENETGVGVATESSPAKTPTKAQSSVSAPIPRLGNKSTTTPDKPAAGPGSSKIPRLGHKSAPDRSNAGKGSRNNNNSGKARSSGPSPSLFGLPEGVHIPGSVHSGLLQGKLLDTLRGLPVQLINDALTEYDDAVQIKGGAIRNHGAYLYGVIKRYVSVQERAQAGEGKGILPMGPELTPAVNARLQKLVIDNFCTEEEMNEKVKSKIRMLSEKDALFAIDELASVERRQIRNFGSYFMGILNRYMRGDKKQDEKKRENRHGRFDNRRRDDQYHPRGRDNNPNDSYRRERSRDRYDQDRRRDSQNDWRNQYDPRRTNPSYHGQNQPPPPPPMGGVPGNPPPPPPRNNPPGIIGNNQYSLQQPPQQRMMQQPNQNMYGQPQPPPPPQMDQSRFVPQSGGPPPASSPYGPQPTHHTPHQGPGGIGCQFNSQAVPPPQYGNPQTGMGNPQAYRGKPPSNSYGVQMNQPHMAGQQPPQSYTNNRFSQPPPPSNNAAPVGWQNNPQGGPQNSHQGQHNIPVDILGLADKAASAVQALQSQNQLQIPPGVPPSMRQPGTNPQQPALQMHHQGMPPQMSMPPQPYSSIPGQQQVPKQNQSMAARRRTTAQISELPITVQYAIQNLQATGQIDGNLDEGILGMVKDLPESLALTAIQKFSTIDQSTMRNKTAYLAGVLRRELEKINRR